MKEKLSKYFKGDAVIWVVIFILSIFSILAVYSSTGTLAYRKMGGNTTYYFLRHTVFLIFGLGITYLFHTISYKYYYLISKLLLYITIPLLVFTLFKGISLNQASRWITLPGIGLSFQTSDLAKFALIIYIARLLSNKQEHIKNFKKAFKPVVLPIIIVCGLILPANFSTAAILFATSLILMFVGRISLKYLFGVIGIGIAFFSIFVIIAINSPNHGRVGTWKKRIESFADNTENDGNYQTNQSKIAIVTGGVFGKGPGHSTQRNFLPHPYSDFIYAIIIEEYGFVGGFFVLLLYIILLYRAGVILKKCERTFPAFLVIGLTFSIVFQAMINMAVAVNIFPVTGQTLPFVSMGGTSIIFTSIAMGIVLSISRTVNENDDLILADEEE
ncbi:MAG: FtsW/RodA/SpoVE family cell cycle protein [Bacteroidetes bacterium]|nr:FtsW/RodA/SpoVE family cell cycle protein [Bacteroidota bacterium]